ASAERRRLRRQGAESATRARLRAGLRAGPGRALGDGHRARARLSGAVRLPGDGGSLGSGADAGIPEVAEAVGAGPVDPGLVWDRGEGVVQPRADWVCNS